MPRRPSFLASSSDSSLRMASSTCDEWMKWLHKVSKNDPDDEERTQRSRCTAHAYCIALHTHTHGRRRRRVIESILRGESNSLSRGADAGQPSGVGEIPLPKRIAPLRRELYPYSRGSAGKTDMEEECEQRNLTRGEGVGGLKRLRRVLKLG